MARQPRPWPTHGNAVEARDKVAQRLYDILNEVDELQALIRADELTRLDLSITSNRIRQLSSEGLMILIGQGAPYLPYRRE